MSPEAGQRSIFREAVLVLGGVALTVFLLVASINLGLAGFVLLMFVAVPAAYVYMRAGAAAGCGVVLIVATGLYLFTGIDMMILYLSQFGITSLLLPTFLVRGWGWDKAVAASVFLIAVATASLLFLYADTTGRTVDEIVVSYVKPEIEQMAEAMIPSDAQPEQLQQKQEIVDQVLESVRLTYFGSAIAGIEIAALFLVWVLSAIARGHYSIPGVKFVEWKAPELLIWPLIAAGFGLAFLEGVGKQVSVNALILILPVYFLQGMAVVIHYFNRRKVTPMVRWLFYMLLVFSFQLISMVITSIGVFDLWIDFRKPRTKTT